MRKIPTIFVRDPDTNLRHVKDEVTPGCEWVFAGEGVATRKYDGTCCLVRDGRLYKRQEVKPGKDAPRDFEAVETDENTGKTVGWVSVRDGEPGDKWHLDAWSRVGGLSDGTYELVGPKVQGNPEGYEVHAFVSHDRDTERLDDAPRFFNELGPWLHAHDYEGIVWHHPDGRMAKIKRKDFPR